MQDTVAVTLERGSDGAGRFFLLAASSLGAECGLGSEA